MTSAPRGNGCAPCGAHGGDPLAFDHDDAVSDRRTAIEIDDVGANNSLRLTRGRLRRQEHERRGEQRD